MRQSRRCAAALDKSIAKHAQPRRLGAHPCGHVGVEDLDGVVHRCRRAPRCAHAPVSPSSTPLPHLLTVGSEA
eukprot:6272926-Prymnesium_polylepis.1